MQQLDQQSYIEYAKLSVLTEPLSAQTPVEINYLHQGGFAFAGVCLFVCLQNNLISCGWIVMKFSGNAGNGTKKIIFLFIYFGW